MSTGRVTQRSMSSAALRGLQSSLGRTQRLQEELSSGRRINRPGDDPAGAVASMKLRSQQRGDEQFLRNIDDAQGRLATADTSLTTISDRLIRVRELAVGSLNGSTDVAGLEANANEILAIRDDVVDLYNTRWLDRPVFGGTVAGSDAVDPTTGAYVGDDADVSVRISRDATLRTDVKGTAVAADTLPALLAKLAADVKAGDQTAMSADLSALDAAHTTVRQGLGDVGARAARLDLTKAKVDSERLDFKGRISDNEEIDLPETIMNLEAQKVGYQAALSAAAKVLQVSLSDYLR